MTMTRELFLAILSLDSYNRGYGSGVPGLSDAIGTQIGTATIAATPEDVDKARAAGFYGISYTVGSGVEDIAAGTTVITYRGTDNFTPNETSGASDITQGWVASLGVPTGQVRMALDFYTAASGNSIYDGAQSDVILTGHSLGGGLAGIVSSLSHTQGLGFDHMPFGAITALLAAANNIMPQLSQFDGIYTTGEALQFVRNGSAQVLSGLVLSK